MVLAGHECGPACDGIVWCFPPFALMGSEENREMAAIAHIVKTGGTLRSESSRHLARAWEKP